MGELPTNVKNKYFWHLINKPCVFSIHGAAHWFNYATEKIISQRNWLCLCR